MLQKSFRTVLILFLVIQFQRLFANDYLGCFEDDDENPKFRYIPGDLNPTNVTPLSCLHACSSRYQFAAVASNRVCLCGNEINSSMKVDNKLCSDYCTASSRNHVCDHVTYYDVFWRKQGIAGLMLHMERGVKLFSRTWFHANALSQYEVEFRFSVDGEIISSWSNLSTLCHIFTTKGEHLIEVTARNKFAHHDAVGKTLNVLDKFQRTQFQCPAASIPENEVVCRGEWRKGSGHVRFDFGDGLSENVYFDTPMNAHNFVANVNKTQAGLVMNGSLGTYVLTTALNLEHGQVSHWSVLVTKPGRIRVQIFRPYCNATDLCLSRLNNTKLHFDTTTCYLEQPYCLTRRQCAPSDKDQRSLHYLATAWQNNSNISYEIISEDVVHIPNIGYHIFPSTKMITLHPNDFIGWTSDGGQLRYIEDEVSVTLQYPIVDRNAVTLQASSYTKMHFGTYALTAYIRQPLKFELHHIYQDPGVYNIMSRETPTVSITVDRPITPFTISVPKLSQTNSTVFLTTGLHNGTGVTYSWSFGDNDTMNTSKSTATHVYTYPGMYLITLYASNSVSKFAVTAGIELLDPITGCYIQPIRASVLGKSSTLNWHCAFGSNVTFSVNFDDGYLAEFRPLLDRFIGRNLSHSYTSAGHYVVKIVVSSPLGVNVSLTEHVLVEIPVKGLEVRLLNVDNTDVLYIATLSEISVERVLERGSHVKCTFDFGGMELPITWADAIVNHTYRRPDTYHVNVTCYNNVSTVWAVLNTTILVEDILPLKNMYINIRPTIFGQTCKFWLFINHGNLFTCEWDLGDNTTYTTSYPQMNSTILHRYRKVGTYNVSVTCRNEVGKETATTLADVDEPIRNVSLRNPSFFVPVNQSAAFILTLSKGSRVKYCLECRGKYLHLGDNVTIATITHAYATAGEYAVIVHLWNSVNSVTVTALGPITVQYPVMAINMFTTQPRCSSLSVAVCLNLTENTHPPTNASVLISYGDNSTETFDFKSQKCFRKHEYSNAGVYNITANVSNHVSSQVLIAKVNIQNKLLKGISAMYRNGSVFQKGLGTNNQYFPARKVLKFEIEQNRGDVSYDWRIGNKSLGDKRVVQKTFPDRGCHDVTVVVESSLLDEECSRNICIEEILHDLNLSVAQPTYFNDHTLFRFSVENYRIPSCFRFNFGDSKTVTFGECVSTYKNLSGYTHVYKQRGNYTVTLTRWNNVSKILRSVEVSIRNEACGSVEVNITGGGFKDRPTIVTESEVLSLDAHVSHKCHVAKMMFVHWSIYEWNFGSEGSLVASDVAEFIISKNSSKLLTNEFLIVASNFGTGFYNVKVTASFIGTDRDLRNITESNFTWFEISRPLLIAQIKGGISRSVSWNDKFVLDGSGSRNLGNTPSNLHFSWLCRLATYTVTTNLTSVTQTSPGCFRNGSNALANTSVLVVDSGGLYPDQEYVFSLQVTEGSRESYAEQSVFVLDGPVPTLDLRCIVNCKETINPSQRLLLKSKCLNCQSEIRLLHYQWFIYICNGTTHSCQELPDFETKTSTGLNSANIATKENVLEIGATYRIRCKAWRFRSRVAGYVDYLLHVNSPPINGHCSVVPKEGFSLTTLFKVSCYGWWDKDKPLSYLIEIESDGYQTYLTSSRQSNISLYLPVGDVRRNFSLGLIVKVSDAGLFSTTTLHSVKVYLPNTVNYSLVIGDIQRAADSHVNDKVFELVLSLGSVMNKNLNSSGHNLTTNSKVRLQVAQILAATNITGLNRIRGLSDALKALTTKADEISLELQDEVTGTIQRTNHIMESFANTSHDIRTVGTSLHRVLSNVVGAMVLPSANTVTMATNASTNNTVTFADMKKKSIQNAFQAIDDVNRVLFQQVLAGDESTSIKTKNYDIKLLKRNIKDLITDDKFNISKFPLELQDTKRLVEYTNTTRHSVLGLTVTDLFQAPKKLYDTTAQEINSNILRVNIKDSFRQPVDMTNIRLSILVNSPPRDYTTNKHSITLDSLNSLKIHRFNRTVTESSLVLIFRVIDPKLSLRAFLSFGQQPTLKKYDLTTTFTEGNFTNNALSFSWVVSRDMLRNITESQELFLGVMWNGGLGARNKSYSLLVAWVKCLISEEEKAWEGSACEVGLLTSLEQTHCICRPGQTDQRVRRSTEFRSKKTFKIAVGAGVFPAPNKIDFHHVFDADILNNPLSLIAVLTVFAIYLILLVYARRQDQKDSEKIGVTALPSNKTSDKYFYEITIFTGSAYNAGTSAHVSITLGGSEGDLGPRILYDPIRQCFQRSSIDTFLISSRDFIGDVSYLQIWHDNTGMTPSWFLDKILVRDITEKQSYCFYNETWLAVENEEGGIQKLLFPACKDEITQFKRLFNSTIHSNVRDRHLWFSLISRPVDSRFTLVQRLSCCLSLLYMTMLANAMFYQETGASTPESSLILGPFIFGLREMVIGIMSAVIIVPVNAGIVWMFRNVEAKPCKGDLRMRREHNRPWWFYELFFCCFKSRLSSSLTRKASDYFYNDGQDLDEDQVSQSETSLKDAPIDILNDTIKLSKKPKESIQLPYWYIYIAWSLVCLTCVVSAFFVVLYGLQFGSVVSSQWLSSLTVSFVQDVLVHEPLKVFAIAVVVALVIKKPQHFELENKHDQRTIINRYIQESDPDSAMPESRDKVHFNPPDKKDLEMARNQRLKELRTGSLLKELCLYLLFLICLSALTYKNKNPMSFHVNKSMRDLFIERNDNTVAFEQISNMNDFITWINETFLDALYFSEETNTVFGHFYLLGCVRVFQDGEVNLPKHTSQSLLHCLNRSSLHDENAIHFAKLNNWLNKRTREININFNVYNPAVNLFCLAKLTAEILPTNGIKTRANFVVTKLFAVGGIFDTFALVSHVFVFVFFLVFSYRELKQVYRWKRKYFRNFWNVLQGILVVVILSCIVVFFLRLSLLEELLLRLEEDHQRFIGLDTLVFVDSVLGNLIAFVVFLSWFRFIKFLQFNRRLSFLHDTLVKIAQPLATYSIVFLTVFFAYFHSGYLLFSRQLETFNNLQSSFTSLCSLFMGDFDFSLLQKSDRVFGPLFIFSALFFGGFIIINLLIALILESFLIVKMMNKANQYDLLEYVKKALRYWFGSTGQNTPRKVDLRDLNPSRSTPGDITVRDKEERFPQRKTSGMKTCTSMQENRLEESEKSVDDVITSLKSACTEDWFEEALFYQLVLQSLKLTCSDCLGYVCDGDVGNLDDLEMFLLRNELYDAVEKYSQDLTDDIEFPRSRASSCDEQAFSTFDLNFEDERF